MTGPTPDTVGVFRALHHLGMNKPGYTLYAAEMISADEVPEAVQGKFRLLRTYDHDGGFGNCTSISECVDDASGSRG